MRMNALYVTVSIPLLLILAGFNHAHGLTTFGKSNNQQQPQSQPPTKICGNHTNCRGIEGTSCVPEPHDSQKKSCLCGNNQPPNNGVCASGRKGPNHTCNENNDCIKGAECMLSPQDNLKVCKCTENPEFNYDCNGGSLLDAFSGLVTLLIVVLTKTLC